MGNSAKVTIEIAARDLTKAAISGVKAGLNGIASALSTVAKLGVAAGAGLVAFTKFAILGEHDAAIAARFDGAMRSLGLSAHEVYQRLHEASGGLVEHADVMRAATQALKGGKFTLDQTALAMEFLRLKAVSTGQDVAEFTKNGIDGLSRGMARGLLPLFPDLNRQLEQLANSGIDGARQKSETLRLVFQRMIDTLPELRNQVGDAGTAAQQFGVAIKDAVSDAATQLAANPETKRFFQEILQSIRDLVAKLPEIVPAVEEAIRSLGGLFAWLSQRFADSIKGWQQLVDFVKATPGTIEASGLAANISEEYARFLTLNPGQSSAARQAYDNTKKRLTDDITRLFDLVGHDAKIQGLATEQVDLLDKALTNLGVDVREGGLFRRMWLGDFTPDKAAAFIRGAIGKTTQSIGEGLTFGPAAGPAPVATTASAAPKIDLSNLGGGTDSAGAQLDAIADQFKALQAAYASVTNLQTSCELRPQTTADVEKAIAELLQQRAAA